MVKFSRYGPASSPSPAHYFVSSVSYVQCPRLSVGSTSGRRFHVATKFHDLKGLARVNVIRFTIVDERGTSSFVGPCHAIKMLVAACSRHPHGSSQLLHYTRPYDEAFARSVESGLAVFDEHNTRENYAAFHRLMESTAPADLPPFRVVDERTRQLSLRPVATGLILFNLKERRIIQVQNSYAEVQRADRGRVRENGRPTRMLYYYSLPEEWNIVP